MTQNQLVLMELKSTIFDMPKSDQDLVQQAIGEIRKLLSQYPNGHCHIALAFVGAELGSE